MYEKSSFVSDKKSLLKFLYILWYKVVHRSYKEISIALIKSSGPPCTSYYLRYLDFGLDVFCVSISMISSLLCGRSGKAKL